jgi:hypothetical protein
LKSCSSSFEAKNILKSSSSSCQAKTYQNKQMNQKLNQKLSAEKLSADGTDRQPRREEG